MEMSFSTKLKVAFYCIKQAITKPSFNEYKPKSLDFVKYTVPEMQRMMDPNDKPIFFKPELAAWCVAGDYDTIRNMLRDPRLSIRFPDWKFAENKAESAMSELEKLNANLLMSLPKESHARVRRAAGPAFSPRTVENLADDIQAIIDDELDKVGPEFDLSALTAAIPLRVITAYIGIPRQYYDELEQVSNSILSSYDPTVHVDIAKANHGLQIIKNVIDEKEQEARALIEEYEKSDKSISAAEFIANRSKDFLTSLMVGVVQREQADDGSPIYITKAEALSVVGAALAAGPDTTKHHINWALIAMLQNPEVIGKILNDPDPKHPIMERAILEGYRWNHLGHSGAVRFALEDVEYFGQTIKKGEMIRIMNCAAVYCPNKFPEPLKYDIDRDNQSEIVLFGLGPHFCLGHAIAKKITSQTIWSILNRFPNLEMLEEPKLKDHFIVRDVAQLRVRAQQESLKKAG